MSEPEPEPEPLLQAQSTHNESAGPREPLSTDDVANVLPAWMRRNPRPWSRIIVRGWLVFSILLLLATGLTHLFRWALSNPPKGKVEAQPKPRVDLGYAQYDGRYLSNGVNQFRGMRYAAPPLGDLRWRAPRAPLRERTRDADTFGPRCYGTDHGAWSASESEDCLFVNVWAPTNANETSKLPVWVYIQGGGYTANSNPDYIGATVVEESGMNVILVNFNYRVGLWGFLAGEQVREDGDLNVGLLDQRQLLKWVKTHIAKFGGDPDRVIIHGVSAGAGSAALHLTAFGGRDDGLFSGVMTQSVFFPAHQKLGDLQYQFNKTLELAGCSPDHEAMSCLRAKTSRELQTVVNRALAFPGRASASRWYWTPCVDGDLIRDLPSAMFEQGNFIKVPLMLGTATDEGSIFSANAETPGQFISFIQDNFPGLTDDKAQEMLRHYPLEAPRPRHQPWFPSTYRAYGETTFICPTNLILDAFSRTRYANRTWSYRYNVWDLENDRRGVGVTHTFDSAAILGPESLTAPISYHTYNAPVIPLMMSYYISFVRSQDPNTHRFEQAPRWETWRGGQRLLVELNKTRMESTSAEQKKRCWFWKSVSSDMCH